MRQRPTQLRRTVTPRHPDAPDLCHPIGVAPFPPAPAAKCLEPVAFNVHRHRVAAVVIRAAERKRQRVVDFEGTVNRLLAVPANPVLGIEVPLAAGGRHGVVQNPWQQVMRTI